MPSSQPYIGNSGQRERAGAWHRQPLLWLGALIIAASLVGCAWVILMALRHPDPTLDAVGLQILRMPLGPAQATAPPPPK